MAFMILLQVGYKILILTFIEHYGTYAKLCMLL